MAHRRSRRPRRNPGAYTYKISGKRPEEYLKDLIDSGEVQVHRKRNQWEPQQEITEIVSTKSPYFTKIKYAETADMTRPTRFEVAASYQYTPIAETIKSAGAAELFREAMAKEAQWNRSVDFLGKIMLAGVGLYLVSTLAFKTTTEEVATR